MYSPDWPAPARTTPRLCSTYCAPTCAARSCTPATRAIPPTPAGPRWPSDERWTEEHGIADRERQVRATAQRLITELLPSSSAPEPESYNLDLTGAALEFFNLSGCHIGQLTARRAHFYGSTRLDNLRASRIMLLSGARFSGRLDLSYARLEDGLSLFEAQAHGEFRVKNTLVWRMLDVRASAPTEQIGSLTAAEDTTIKPEPPNGWALAAKQAAPTEIASAT